ncbi:MAG: hypothetical protein N2117_03895 [Anaerolineales bacterium]|nr:hypothetical protein [Anaerolineales bacterium]
MNRHGSPLWLARGLILPVTAWNLQAATVFFLWPERFAPSFLLEGIPGAVAVRGVGLLFLMWNVPYLAALWQPVRNRLALQLAALMQAVGLMGETYILTTLTPEYSVLAAAIMRFIVFDAAGLLLLLGALRAVDTG